MIFHALLVLAPFVQAQEPTVSGPDVLRVGQKVEVRGELDSEGRFVARKIELEMPASDDTLLGQVPVPSVVGMTFELLGQLVEWDEETEWKDLEKGKVAGQRVKVEGSWKGPRKFKADSIEPRDAGRDRIAGRIDALTPTADGFEARMMIFTVLIAKDTEVEHAKPVAEYPLVPERKIAQPGNEDDDKIERDEDDAFGKGYELSDTLRLMGQIEGKIGSEKDYDLRSEADEDRTDYDANVRLRMTWSPSEKLAGLVEARYTHQYRRDDDAGVNDSEVNHSGSFGETWLQWRDVMDNAGFDVTVGRQDFDDPREWIFDQNLDALRLSWIRKDWRLDVAGATVISGGGERDEESTNATVYLSNNDEDEHLAVWTVWRDIDSFNGDNGFVPDESSWHVGARALGEWVPQNNLWADFALLSADRPQFDLTGTSTGVDESVTAFGYDVGTTWSPPFAAPLYFSLGYAYGQGEGADGTFRQTGWEDNTHRFGGVTSFQYYGELLDPELSNLGIVTLGVGTRFGKRTSLDLVYHTYTQDEERAEFSPLPSRSADLKRQPNGDDADLGWELDLVFGYRQYKNWDLEIVGAHFEPGDGFDEDDSAQLLKFQVRYRF
jgi:alginate production protein